MFRRFVLFSLSGLFCLAMNGCVSTDATTIDTQDFRQTRSKVGPAGVAELAAGNTLELSVEVDGRMEVPSFQASINHLGFVTLPLVGDVHVGGVSLDVARNAIAKRYGDYYVSPPVIMLSMVDQNRKSEWGQVTVMGRVNNPGPVPLASASGMRLSAVIQAAGGFAPSAKSSEIQITRVDVRGRKLRVVVNFDEIGKAGNADADLMLMSGDIVNIPERIW